MFRRGVALAVMLGYVAGQLAAVPHAHAEGHHLDHHSSQPHVHLSWFGSAHDDHDDDPAVDYYQEHSLTHALGSVRHDHDDDAIYLSPVVVTGLTGSESLLSTLTWQSANGWLGHSTASEPVFEVPLMALHERPPRLTGEHCALFLKLRSLRI